MEGKTLMSALSHLHRFFILCLCGLLLMGAFPARAQLSPDQSALLAEVEAAFALREAWTSYEQYTEVNELYALTVDGLSQDEWQTSGLYIQLEGSYTPDSTEAELLWEDYGQDEVQSVNKTFASRQGDDYELEDPSLQPPFDLEALLAFDHPLVPAALLEHTLQIYDLGRSGSEQSYELELDPEPALAELGFDLDDFAAQFEGWVDIPSLEAALLEDPYLSLGVTVDTNTGELLGLDLYISLLAQVSGEAVLVSSQDGLLNLDYSLFYTLAYSN
jgi:hypothetical protein